MLEGANPVQSEMIASALDWWALAGVDTHVEEVATAWLDHGKGSAAVSKSPTLVAPAAQVEALPKTVPDFAQWLRTTPSLAFLAPPEQRLAPSGDAKAALMIMIDMPELGDAKAGQLLSGEVGVLFDNMLKAINQSRESVWLASFAPGRPPGGMFDANAILYLTELARHHLGLIRPKRLWLMGQTVSRALGGADASPGAGLKRNINYEGGIVESVASFNPAFLLANPKRKAAAWADMQILAEGL